MNDSEKIDMLIRRYGVSVQQAEIMVSRQKVYGDPYDNHLNIAQIWAGLLQPWAKTIAQCKPVPPHVIALMLAGLKYSRMRLKFHEDNFDDVGNYQMFAKAWHKEWEERGGSVPPILDQPPKDSKKYELQLKWVAVD